MALEKRAAHDEQKSLERIEHEDRRFWELQKEIQQLRIESQRMRGGSQRMLGEFRRWMREQ